MLQGIKGNDITITIEKPDGFQEEIAVKMDGNYEKWYYPIAQNRNNKIVEFEQLDNNIGYLAINSFSDSLVLSEFKKILPKLYDQKGLIIDVRRNGGGNSGYAHEITKYLTDKTYFFGEQGSTRKHLASHKAWGAFADSAYASSFGFGVWKNEYADYFYGNVWEMEQRDSIINDVPDEKLLMPLVVLISNKTASATEDFLIGLDYLDRGVFIGQKTFGSTGQPIFFSLPNGGRFRICTRKCTYPDGRKFIGIGIKPDIEIEPNLQYYLSDEDIVLNKGIEYLIKEIKKADNSVYKK